MKHRMTLWSLIALLAVGVSARAAIIAQDKWEGSTVDGWAVVDDTTVNPLSDGSDHGTVSFDGALAGHSALKIDGSAVADAEDFISDSGFAPSGPLGPGVLPGNWIAAGASVDSGALSLDFYSNPGGGETAPSSLKLYFYSDTTDNTWLYDLNVGSGWSSHLAELSYSQWDSSTGTEAQFATDMADVDEVGIWITYHEGIAGQVYGIDNFQLHDEVIPEPGTYSMLGFAMLSLGMTFRRKLNAAWAGLKKS